MKIYKCCTPVNKAIRNSELLLLLFNQSLYIVTLTSLLAIHPMKAGVPQGSELAPTLYNLYMTDIPTSRNSNLAQYADDTTI